MSLGNEFVRWSGLHLRAGQQGPATGHTPAPGQCPPLWNPEVTDKHKILGLRLRIKLTATDVLRVRSEQNKPFDPSIVISFSVKHPERVVLVVA